MIKGSATESPATPWWLPSFTGFFLGFLFFVLTFTPSLVPRPPIFQGLLGGLAFFIGYAVGHGGALLWRYLELPEVPRPWWRAANIVLALACAIFAALYLPQAAAWQDEVRGRLNMTPAETSNFMQVVLVAAVVAILMSAKCQRRTLAANANCFRPISNLAGAEQWHSRLPEVEQHRSCLRRCTRFPEAEHCHSRLPRVLRRRNRLPEAEHSRTRRGVHNNHTREGSKAPDTHIAGNNAASSQCS